jgi:hypothetical protein
LPSFIGDAGDRREPSTKAPAAWTSETVVAVEAHKARLATVFEASRERADSADSTTALAAECESIARQVLSALYPDTR